MIKDWSVFARILNIWYRLFEWIYGEILD